MIKALPRDIFLQGGLSWHERCYFATALCRYVTYEATRLQRSPWPSYRLEGEQTLHKHLQSHDDSYP